MFTLNGRPVTVEELAPLALCNYGHFTSMRVIGGRVRGLDLHLQRLARDCRELFDKDLDTAAVRQFVRAAVGNAEDAVVRVTVYDPTIDLGHPDRADNPKVLVSVRPAPAVDLPPLRLTAVEYERDAPASKHVGLFATIAHRRAAQLAGYDDVLFTDRRGHVTEGATWNFGMIAADSLVWPEADQLPGVTAQLISQLADQAGVRVDSAKMVVVVHRRGRLCSRRADRCGWSRSVRRGHAVAAGRACGRWSRRR